MPFRVFFLRILNADKTVGARLREFLGHGAMYRPGAAGLCLPQTQSTRPLSSTSPFAPCECFCSGMFKSNLAFTVLNNNQRYLQNT